MEYDLNLDKAVQIIKKEKAKVVCIQLPDGLKPMATEIASYLEKNTMAKIVIWLNSNWGACDVPLGLETVNVDLLINFGHNSFGFKNKISKKGYIEIDK
ncbi:diphthamide synthesis protein [Candidatus Woesearchaeota archaeon]|nr:diphthamide synthesis protein [Candidatus Woesearchaeota archaeon]